MKTQSKSSLIPKPSGGNVARPGLLPPRLAAPSKDLPGKTALPGRPTTVEARTPNAPPIYRPQPLPRVLQSKTATVSKLSGQQAQNAPTVPAVYRPQRAPMVKNRSQSGKVAVAPSRVVAVQPTPQQKKFQLRGSNAVQATKYYPNLHPGAVEPIDNSNIFRLNSFADQYRLRKVNSHGVNVPNQQYNFVRTREGETLLHSRYRHPSIAEGKQVLYAGEIFFNNGKLQWWSNGSGHYQPYVEDAEQANLPMDSFFSYQQIIKGEHTRRKS